MALPQTRTKNTYGISRLAESNLLYNVGNFNIFQLLRVLRRKKDVSPTDMTVYLRNRMLIVDIEINEFKAIFEF